MTTNRKVTDEQIELIRTLSIKGQKIREISVQTGVPEKSIGYWRMKLGLSGKKKKAKLEQVVQKMPVEDISIALSGSQIKGFFRDNGSVYCVTESGNGFSFKGDIECLTRVQVSDVIERKKREIASVIRERDNLNLLGD